MQMMTDAEPSSCRSNCAQVEALESQRRKGPCFNFPLLQVVLIKAERSEDSDKLVEKINENKSKFQT